MLLIALLVFLGFIWLILGRTVAKGVGRNLVNLEIGNRMLKQQIECPPEWAPFLRHKCHMPPRWRLYLTAYTIGPFRFIIFSLCHIFAAVAANVLPREKFRTVARLICHIILWAVGLEIVQVGTPDGSAPGYVGNHVGTLDAYLFLAQKIPICFLGRAEIEKMFLVGNIVKKLGFIFVKRQEGASRSESGQNIVDYLSHWKPGMPHLFVFPEGTTTNGLQTIPFKSGAFRSLTAVQPVRLEYQSPLDPFVNTEDFESLYCLMMCLPRRKIVINWLETLKPKQGETPDELAKRAQEAVNGQVLSYAELNGYRVHRDVEEFIKQKIRERDHRRTRGSKED